jgi:hypothetical protein
MAMSYRLWTALPCAALLLAACNTTRHGVASHDPAFGEAAKWNAAVHTINPDPVYSPQGAQPGGSGAKGAEAVKRYRTDNVKDVRVLTTTSDSAGSGEPR